MLNIWVKWIAAGALASWVTAAPSLAKAQDEDAISYTFEAGDTLYGLAREYFVSSDSVPRIQELNGIANDRAIPVGRVISVPRSLLKWDPVPLRVGAFTGDVSIARGRQMLTPRKGLVLVQNTIVTTGARSFISLQGEGRTAVSLPSNSRVQIKRARRYRLGNLLDVDLRVLRGRGTITAPKIGDNERFRTGTPLAVTAVRGTEFRVGYNDEEALALTEVVEGLVDVSADGSALAISAGTGLASNPSGLGKPEELLAAPELVDPNATQTGKTVSFALVPVEGAVAYRTQVAEDQTFLDVIAEEITISPQVSFGDLPDARLSVRSRAIAQSGLEGFETGAEGFRRKRVGTSGGVEPSPFADAYKFAWTPKGSSVSYAGFRLWEKGKPETLLIDEVGLSNEGIYVSNLAPGIYQWQVSTFVVDEDEVFKIWSDPQDLPVRD